MTSSSNAVLEKPALDSPLDNAALDNAALDNAALDNGNFRALETEHDYWVDEIIGTLPADLTGTFFRNGPGRHKIGNEKFGHWFDGDGMIARTTFTNGKVHFANRFIRTPKYVAETKAQKIVYRGLGTQRKGGLLANFMRPPANPANTSLILHADRFLALYEGGRPYEVDPSSLDTLGEYDYQGELGAMDTFSAHGKVNPSSKYYYNFSMSVIGFKFGKPQFGINIFQISPEGKMIARESFPTNQMTMVHDFALTENYAIVFLGSVSFKNLFSSVVGLKPMISGLNFDDGLACKVLVIDLKTLKLVKTFEIDPCLVVHFGNAYEKEGDIHLDAMRQTNIDFEPELENIFDPDVSFAASVGAQYRHFIINLKNNSIQDEAISDQALMSEFPQWDWKMTTRENRFAITATYVDHGKPTFFNAVQVIDRLSGDVKIHDFGVGRFSGEPMIVAKKDSKNEGDFYILNYVYNENEDRSEVTIIDSNNIGEDLAVIKLKHHVPQGFHGMFTPKTFIE